MRKLLYTTLLLCLFYPLLSQGDQPPKSAEERYQWRIQQSKLYGVYIPRDLTDAFLELNRLIEPDAKAKFKKASEAVVAQKLHFSLGQWMMVNWGFYEGSRLTAFLNKLDLHHPDDMARFLIVTFHRSLNQEPLAVKALVETLVAKRSALKQERLEKGTVLEETTRQRTKVDSTGQGQQ
ncbi:MAG: DUF6794 domain-containing protein [Bacteroidota bacterium]